MNSFPKLFTLALSCTLATALLSLPAAAADAPATSAPRVAFDGNIKNNSLALSPDESTAVVSYSERRDIIVYDLQANTVRGVLMVMSPGVTSSSHPTARPFMYQTAAVARSSKSTAPRLSP